MANTTLLLRTAPEIARKRIQHRARMRKVIWSVVSIVVLLHVAVGVVAGIFVVVRYLAKPAPKFERQKDALRLPAQEREHRINMAEFDALAPKPSFNDKLQALKPTAFALPDLPKIPLDQLVPLDPGEIVSDQVSSLVGAAAMGGGSGNGGTGEGGTGSGVSFFGIQDTARRVVILVDTSDSMFVRSLEGKKHHFKFATIKEQAVQLINKLDLDTRFNVVVYEGGALAFNEQNVAATDRNKTAAQAWLQALSENPSASINTRTNPGPKLMEGPGTRLDTGFKQAFQMKPDVIYLITDGQISSPTGESDARIIERQIREVVRNLQKTLPEPARIHVIYYVTVVARPEEARRLKAIAGNNQGQFRQVQAEEKNSVAGSEAE